jgi:hypothetical protein
MAEFIAMMRMEEAAADEEDFWRTNHLRRWQRDWRVFWDTSKVSVLQRWCCCCCCCCCRHILTYKLCNARACVRVPFFFSRFFFSLTNDTFFLSSVLSSSKKAVLSNNEALKFNTRKHKLAVQDESK